MSEILSHPIQADLWNPYSQYLIIYTKKKNPTLNWLPHVHTENQIVPLFLIYRGTLHVVIHPLAESWKIITM